MTAIDRIKQQLQNNPIVLYMKGTPEFPQCGFSARVVQILENLGYQYQAVNVLEDQEIRQAIKEYGDWPTIPQLYVNGELMGDSDILLQYYNSGELKAMIDEAVASSN